MSSSFGARSAESLDSTPTQASSRTSRHRLNSSSHSVTKTSTASTATSTSQPEKHSTNNCSEGQYHKNRHNNSSSMSSDISHNNNKNSEENGVVEVDKDFSKHGKSTKSLSQILQEDRSMSPEQTSLDHNQHEPQLKVNEASRSSEMPDLSEQPSTFTRSATSTATLMAEATKDRISPSHSSSLKIDHNLKMMPMKQRTTLSEDEAFDEKVKITKTLLLCHYM